MRIPFDRVAASLLGIPPFAQSVARLTNARNLANLAYIRQVIRSSNYFSSFSLTLEGTARFLPPFFSLSLSFSLFFFHFRAFAFFTTQANSPLNSLLEISPAALHDRRNHGKGNAFPCVVEVFLDCTKQIA